MALCNCVFICGSQMRRFDPLFASRLNSPRGGATENCAQTVFLRLGGGKTWAEVGQGAIIFGVTAPAL